MQVADWEKASVETRIGKNKHVKMERRGYKKGRSYLSKLMVGMLVLHLITAVCS